MKTVLPKIIFAFLLLMASMGMDLQAQVIKAAVLGGMNVSQVDGDEVYGFHKVGLNLGAAAIIPFSDHWEVSMELSYSQKGAYQKPQRDYDTIYGTGEYQIKLNYLEIPVLVHFNDKDRIKFGLGFSWGRLVGVEEYEHGELVPTTTLNGPYSRNDFAGLADIRIRLYKRLKVNIRYGYSLVKIRTRTYYPINGAEPWTRKQYNNYWTLRLIYVINEEQSARARRERQTP